MDDSVPGCRLTRSFGAVQLARADISSRLRAKTEAWRCRVSFVMNFMAVRLQCTHLQQKDSPAGSTARYAGAKCDASGQSAGRSIMLAISDSSRAAKLPLRWRLSRKVTMPSRKAAQRRSGQTLALRSNSFVRDSPATASPNQ